MHPALLYFPGQRLSQPELSAARIDGHLVEVGDAYIPADLVEGPDVRASSIAHIIQTGTAASGPSAAWIHGAGDVPPSVHHVRRYVERRLRPIMSSRVVFHDTLLPASDVILIGGAAVSTPVRTMLDLATSLHRDPRMMTWMDRLAAVQPDTPGAAAAVLSEMRRVPGSRVGSAVLQRLALRKK